jgi:hypothetical protein
MKALRRGFAYTVSKTSGHTSAASATLPAASAMWESFGERYSWDLASHSLHKSQLACRLIGQME